MSAPLHVAAEVAEAIDRGGPVVALETTLAAHGFPAGEGAAVAVAAEQAVRATGAVPATVGVVDGLVRVGLAPDELERIARAGPAARKTGPRDLAAAAAQRALGATTVGGTLLAVRLAGIRVMATGGLGGVHRGFPAPPDVSADLLELARTPALVVSAGVKSLLDVAATAEALETLGVPVLGWRTDEMPRFYSARGGPPVSARVETADEAAAIAQAHWGLGGGGLLLACPPDEGLDDIEPLIERAVAEASRAGVAGKDVTPFVLERLHAESGGATLRVNRALILANARLAGVVATAISGRSRKPGGKAPNPPGAVN